MNATETTNTMDSNPAHSPSNGLGTYQPSVFEPLWAKWWEAHKIGAPSGIGEPFTLLIPPPNVTGHLHMGHGFQLSLMDTVVRYMRMNGRDVRWVVGTDHAGIATQMVVERQLESQNTSRTSMGRDAFLKAVWAWKKESGTAITEQMRRIGITVDWEHERFTMDEPFNYAVRHSFVSLYQQGLIYRGTRLVHWDTVFQTAVSDLEVEYQSRPSHLCLIAYTLVQPTADTPHLTVATTRPETLFGDTAIAVHPDDPRYQFLIGQHVRIPLSSRCIPVIADPAVDPEFGTGVLKITPAHDPNDYAIGQRHHLSMINVFHPDGTLNEQVPPPFRGLDRFEGRKQILEALKDSGALLEIRDHVALLPIGDRSQSILEPYLTPQWYLNTQKLAQMALDAAESGHTQLLPEHWLNSYRAWLKEPQDWCISRQLWWGHRIPAWYDAQGQVYVGMDEASVRAAHQLADTVELREEDDVLDTWFSSALWPLETLGFYEGSPEFTHRYPTDLLVTGFDILFFWVARMSMMGLHFAQEVPFKDVLITGLIRDAQGQKMSKSKGNILDPLHLINGVDHDTLVQSRTHGLMQSKLREQIKKQTEKDYPHGIEAHGADALRLTFCALHNSGQDVLFDADRLVGFRNFCNKLWNVGRLIEHRAHSASLEAGPWSIYDHWMHQHSNRALTDMHEFMRTYRFDRWVQVLQDWAWTFTDWYCEIAKILLKRQSTSGTLSHLNLHFDRLLQAAHPAIPFITEELGQLTARIQGITRPTLAQGPYPSRAETTTDTQVIDDLCTLITLVRNIKALLNIKPNQQVTVYLPPEHAESSFAAFLGSEEDIWRELGKIEAIHFIEPTEPVASHYDARLGRFHVGLGSIDIAQERDRLAKQEQKWLKEYEKIKEKISQPHYRDKAPLAIKTTDQANLARLEQALQECRALMETLSSP